MAIRNRQFEIRNCAMEVEKHQEKRAAKKVTKTKEKSQFVWLGTYITLAVIFLGAYVLIRFDVIAIPDNYHDLLQKFSLAGFFGILILSASKIIEIIIVK